MRDDLKYLPRKRNSDELPGKFTTLIRVKSRHAAKFCHQFKTFKIFNCAVINNKREFVIHNDLNSIA
uniref:Uncharacterized protein n=1 Tax=Glossina palpalis gambiensis TaxID=67801 RepID=A0A1B0B768_9MUSC